MHIPQFTHLKGTIGWFFAYSQVCSVLTTVNFRTFLSSRKETYSALAVILQSPTPHLYTTTNLFCVYLFIYSGHFMYGTIEFVVLWLASFIKHNVFTVHPCCITDQYFIPFLLPNNILLHGNTGILLTSHQLLGVWVLAFFEFWLL